MKKYLILIPLFIIWGCSAKEEIKTYQPRDFYNNVSISGGSFSQDESRVLFSSNESGIFNLYEINIANGEKRQITNSTLESFFAYGYVPGTSQMCYGADKGGNELTHIYLLDPDGKTIDLTPGEKEKAEFGGWSRDKQWMYFNSTRRDPRFFDLYKFKTGEWKPEMIWQNDEGLMLHSLSADNKYIAVGKNITTSENQLFIIDLIRKKRIEISDPGTPGAYIANAFTNDGKYLFYVTDSGKEFRYLVKYNISTGDRETFYETGWDVVGSYPSENDKYLIIFVNEDAANKLILWDMTAGKAVDLPQITGGNILGVEISDSEGRLLITAGTSRTPADLYSFDFASGELKKLTSTLNPVINSDNLVQAEVIRYKSFDGLAIPAIFYKPVKADANNKAPAVVYVHGGPGGQTRISYNPQIQCLVNHGYAVLGVNNRGSSGYGKTFNKMDDRNHGDKDLRDCIWGKKWLQEQDFIDSTKIAIMGGSYGGYMTMAAMTFAPAEFDAGVNIFGVTNWIRTLKSIPPDWEANRKALYTELGDPYSEDSARLYNISPLFHAEQIRNPVLVLQGANDRRVLQVESDEIVAAMKKNNIPVEYVIFPDEGHGFVKKENSIKALEHVLGFLNKYLKQEEAVDR